MRAEVPFAWRAASWQSGLLTTLLVQHSEVAAFHPDHYVPGDFRAMADIPMADADVMLKLEIERRKEPLAFVMDLKDIAGPGYDDSNFEELFVVPDVESASVKLVAFYEFRPTDDDLTALRRDDPLSPWVQVRRLCEQRGANLRLYTARAGYTVVTVERELGEQDLTYFVTPGDQSTFEYPYRQLHAFVEVVVAADSELRGRRGRTQSQGGGCYIATAVYGSYDAPPVLVLRRFRDERLSQSILGRIFIRAYYAVSPTMAKHFVPMTPLNQLARRALDGIIRRIERATPRAQGVADK